MPARVLLSLILAAVASAASAAEPCWPQWRGPNRDGKAIDAKIRTDWEANPPQLLWTAEGFGEGFASVAIVGDRLYTTGNVGGGQAGTAFDLSTRQIAWQTPITDGSPKHGYGGSRCTPTVVGDRLYVTTSGGGIACLDLAGGKVLWSKKFDAEYGSGSQAWGYAESPLVDGRAVIVTPGSKDALMVALDRETGSELWRTPYGDFGPEGKQEAGYSSIVISNGADVKQYVQMTGKGAVGVRAADGKLLWHYNRVANNTAVIPTPLVEGNDVFVSSGYGTGSALLKLSRDGSGVKAQEVYFLKGNEFQNHHGQMILEKGYVYAGRGHNEGFPACLELKTGKLVWGDKLRGPGKGSAAVIFADGHLVFRYQSGEVALIEATPKQYRLKGSFRPDFVKDPSWAHPVVCGGKLYLREQDKLMCYDITPR